MISLWENQSDLLPSAFHVCFFGELIKSRYTKNVLCQTIKWKIKRLFNLLSCFSVIVTFSKEYFLGNRLEF